MVPLWNGKDPDQIEKEDPDPYQSGMDPQDWFSIFSSKMCRLYLI
jgi:hypothetical protein